MGSAGMVRVRSSSLDPDRSAEANADMRAMAAQFNALFGGLSSDLGVFAFRSFANAFLASIDGRVARLVEAIRSHNPKDTHSMAHQLRTSFGSLGAADLEHIAEQLESMSVNGGGISEELERQSLEQFTERVPQLKKNVEVFLTTLPEVKGARGP